MKNLLRKILSHRAKSFKPVKTYIIEGRTARTEYHCSPMWEALAEWLD